MNKRELNDAIANYNISSYRRFVKPVDDLRLDFIDRFNPDRILSMNIDEYVQGKQIKEDNFCYEIEWKLGSLGLITGHGAEKFGIYWSKDDGDYRIVSKFNKGTLAKSFKFLKQCLYDLIIAGENEDYDTIRNSPFAATFKGKILATYFQDTYLSIFSEAHLDYFIQRLDLESKVKSSSDIFDKRNILVAFKNRHPIMRKWPLHAFARFLYEEYPKRPPKDSVTKLLKGIEFIDGEFLSIEDKNSHTSSKGKTDFEEANKSKALLGERGEDIVMQAEKDRLKHFGVKGTPKQVSAEDDSLGYDILSFSEDGSQRYIEVKATNSTPKDFRFFISSNEVDAARYFKSKYHIYIVFKPYSSRPIIYDIGNPFIEDGKVKLIPVSYKIHLQKID